MTREEMQDILKRVPREMTPQVVFHLANGNTVILDSVIQFEPSYVAVRGREGGVTDDARAFFMPYQEVSFIKIDRIFRIGELRVMYGLPDEDKPISDAEGVKPSAPAPAAGTPARDQAPADIARQNLMALLRARTNTGGSK
jgi:hypothetical protein